MLSVHPISRIGSLMFLVVIAILAAGPPAPGYLVSNGSLGPLFLGPDDWVEFNTDTGEFSINGGPFTPGGAHDANGAMVFNFTVIELNNTTPITAYGTNPLALAAVGPVTVAGPINLRGGTPSNCGTVVIAGGGRNGAGSSIIGRGGGYFIGCRRWTIARRRWRRGRRFGKR